MTETTVYRGFTILVDGQRFVILDREGRQIASYTSAVRMRTHIRQLLRAEREAARADA